ncbi:nuclear transport factor 2 family protein [Streptomyces sp. NPDC005963]|uniref:nuclear transport factor 2 family protein n=1 Tax=Streptomyces sp. NPDC005963 TaxID=3156721 RepID=UPI0033FAAEA7
MSTEQHGERIRPDGPPHHGEDRGGRTARQEVVEVIHTYFDGLHHGDTGRLGQVFHPDAIYASATGGDLRRLTMAEYLPVVEGREPPAARRELRRDRIVSIEFAGPVTASARVECAIGPRLYTDFLSLVFLDGEWRIIAKVFDSAPLPSPELLPKGI